MERIFTERKNVKSNGLDVDFEREGIEKCRWKASIWIRFESQIKSIKNQICRSLLFSLFSKKSLSLPLIITFAFCLHSTNSVSLSTCIQVWKPSPFLSYFLHLQNVNVSSMMMVIVSRKSFWWRKRMMMETGLKIRRKFRTFLDVENQSLRVDLQKLRFHHQNSPFYLCNQFNGKIFPLSFAESGSVYEK